MAVKNNIIRDETIIKEKYKLNQYIASIYESGETFKINEIYSLDNVVEIP
ncbi:hypothetical protein [Helicobacter pullorum]|nr:hypothetical protein [Helicobacter pullorum]